MDRSIGDSHCGGVIRCNTVRAMGTLDHHRRAEFAGIDQILDLLIAAVVAAHEADLYQMPAGRHLRINDCLAVRSGVSQRLFAVYRLACLDGRDNRGFVKCARRGDNNRVHIGIVDRSMVICIDLGVSTGDLCAPFRTGFGNVTYCDNRSILDAVLDSFNMLAADHAAADHCNSQGHNGNLRYWSLDDW